MEVQTTHPAEEASGASFELAIGPRSPWQPCARSTISYICEQNACVVSHLFGVCSRMQSAFCLLKKVRLLPLSNTLASASIEGERPCDCMNL